MHLLFIKDFSIFRKGKARVGTSIFSSIENLYEAQALSSVKLTILVHCKFRVNPFVMYNFMFTSVILLLN